jgi:hypothetical protein
MDGTTAATMPRWAVALRVGGLLLLAVAIAVTAYARFGGQAVGPGLFPEPGSPHYLVSPAADTTCTVGGLTLLVPAQQRGLLDGTGFTTEAAEELTCERRNVRLTSGPLVLAHPLAEQDWLTVLLGSALVVVPGLWFRRARPQASAEGKASR